MNVKFNNVLLLEKFKSKSLVSVEFGSNLYGIKNNQSDSDIMLVYLDSDFELKSCFGNHHQFQYKDVENNTDYIITSLSNFIRNLFSGDSTINFEIVQSGSLLGSKLEFLDSMKNDLFTYRIIRSYVGLARRDLTDYWKQNSDRDKNKAIFHGIRGYNYAKSIFTNKEIKLGVTDEIDYNYIMSIDNVERKQLSIKYQNLVKDLRDYVNNAYDNGRLGLYNYVNPNIQSKIDIEINKLYNECNRIEFPDEFKELIYNVNEYGIKY